MRNKRVAISSVATMLWQTLERTNPLLIIGTVALATALLVLDLLTPNAMTVEILYVLVVMMALWSTEPKYMITVAGVCTLLIMLGSSPQRGTLWTTLGNQLLALLAIWATAVIGAQHLRAKEALRAKEHELSNFLENAVVGLHWVGPDGRILWANRAELSMLGYTKEEYVGHHLAEIHADQPALDDVLQRLNRGETLRNYELRLRCRDGSIKHVLLDSNVRWEHGRFVHSRCVTRDITGWKLAEDALRQTTQQLNAQVTDLERRHRESSLLNEMGDLLQTCHTPEEAHAVIARYAELLFERESGALCLMEAQNLLETVAHWGENLPSLTEFAPEECLALRRGQMHHVPELRSGMPCPHIGPPVSGGYLCVPMLAHGEALGVLIVQSGSYGEQPGCLTEAQQHLAITVARNASLALANLKLRDTLRLQSIHDPLTGLYNRRYMEETMKLEMRRAARRQYPIGIILLDLDHFKHFNDAFGHAAGDAVLRAVAECLHNQTREHDLVCRYGGEEFVLILSESSLDHTRERAEELREQIKRLQVTYSGQQLGPVTVSMGVVAHPNHGSSVESLLSAADGALYRAKAAGRDQFAIGHPEHQPPLPLRLPHHETSVLRS